MTEFKKLTDEALEKVAGGNSIPEVVDAIEQF